jgi:hypothetical protein
VTCVSMRVAISEGRNGRKKEAEKYKINIKI